MKKLLLLLLSAILFTSCSEPEDVNKYKGCVVMKKMPKAIDSSYDILYIKLTPELKSSSELNGFNVKGDFYRLCLYKLDSDKLNVGDTIK